MWPQRFVYAVHALVLLAVHGGARLSSARIAEESGIPHKYLESILTILRRAGFVSSSKGPSGGYTLAVDPSTIRLSGVFDTLETEAPGASMALLDSITADLRERLETATVAEALMHEQARRNALTYVI